MSVDLLLGSKLEEEIISLTTDAEAEFPVYKKYKEQELLKLILLKKDCYFF